MSAETAREFLDGLIENKPVGRETSSSNGAGEVEVLPENTAQADTPAQQSDDEIIRHLASLKPLEYDRVRKEQAKKLGVQIKTLDAMVKAARADESEADRLPFPEVESHPGTIDPAQLLSEVSDTIRQFIVLDTEQADAAALWIALTWLINDVEYAPLLVVTAPEKACAKTLLLELLALITYRPLQASNASAAALFRSVEKWRPTILFDECDTFFKENFELHGMVNAGYKSSGFVLRTVGESFEPQQFSVFSAKALAGIALEKHLPDATLSRGIVINLRRKLPHEKVIRLRHADSGLFATIASKLANFADNHAQQVRLARPALPESLSDRQQDNWYGLFAIASCAGPGWLARAMAAALKLSGAGEKTQSTGNELLSDIQHIFENKKLDKISTVHLIESLCSDEERRWSTYNNGKTISPRQVARLLSSYDIASKTIRVGAYDTPKGFELAQFSKVFACYLSTPPNLPPHPPQTLEANKHAVLTVAAHPPQKVNRLTSVTPEAAPSFGCGGVAAKEPILGGTDAILSKTSHRRI